jgi:VanZ family protein
MSNKWRSLRPWINAWGPVALGIVIIALETQEFMGSNYTNGPFRHLYEALFGNVSNRRWEVIHHLIRKGGHFGGYGLIGLAWLRAWWKTLPHSRFFQDAILALLGTALMASCDEWHQSYIPNRTGTPWDVLLDCTGAVALQLLVYSYLRIFQPKRLQHPALY